MNTYYITTPIYYVNAKPHIGHVYTNIAADVLARWHRQQGANVLFSTGTDENSQKNVAAAEAVGRPVQDYVDDMAAVWEGTFRELNLSHDVFIRTTSPEHRLAVTAFIERLTKQGDIYEGEYEGWYCVGCEAFIAENEVVDGQCPIHHTPLEQLKEKNYFFRLTKYQEALLKHYEEHPHFLEPVSAQNKLLDYIKHDLTDISISRQAQAWGIRLPQDPHHAVYVWFDALINYLTVVGYPQNEARVNTFWPADLHLIGKDIIKFHGAIWPAMLLAADIALPKKIFAHGFFTINGEKISKSLGNAIDPLELAKEYPLDAIRYYLLREIPFGNDGDFSHERLKERYNADLANGLGNLVSRTLNMVEKFIPDFSPSSTVTGKLHSEVAMHLESLAFDQALTAIWRVIGAADETIERTKPWQLAKAHKNDEVVHVLTELVQQLVELNEALAPFLPETHAKLTEFLGARPLKKPATPLFARKE